MDLDTQVDPRTDGLAEQPHGLGGVFDLLRMGLEIGSGFVLVEQRVEMSEGGKAEVLETDGLFDQLFTGSTLHMAVHPRLMPHLAAQQLVNRDIVELALDVPQGNVDGRNSAVDRAARKVVCPVHHIPMVLDRTGVLANEVLPVLGDARSAGLQLAPGAGLADTRDTGVGLDPNETEAVDHQRLDLFDLHGVAPQVVQSSGTKTTASGAIAKFIVSPTVTRRRDGKSARSASGPACNSTVWIGPR